MASEGFDCAGEGAEDLNEQLFDGHGGERTVEALGEAVVTVGWASVVGQAQGWSEEEIGDLATTKLREARGVLASEQEGGL